MAKTQGLSLNPQKISGLCGRLMCCLSYENDYYAETGKQMPKVGTELNTPAGKGIVVNVNMLKMLVRVRIEDKAKDSVIYKDYSLEELNLGHTEKTYDDEEESGNGVKEVIAEKVKEDEPLQNGGEVRQNKNRKHKKKNKGGNKPNGEKPSVQGGAQGNTQGKKQGKKQPEKQGEKQGKPEAGAQNGGKKKKNKFRNFQNKNA